MENTLFFIVDIVWRAYIV